jgi:hypothetical protein
MASPVAGVLYEGQGTGKLQFDKKKLIFFSPVNLYKFFGHQNPGSGSGLDLDPDQFSV